LGVILEARDLAIGYPGRMVGRGLDVSLNEGEALALLGPNGGGKTTLLKTLLGLIPPLGGEIRLTGRPLGGLSVRERARLIAYVPQVHAGAFAFTVEDVVLMGRNAHGDLFSRPSARDRQVAAAAIERLGIAHLADRPYTMISGGERQLALIARALAQEPRAVVLDEPTASLDFGNQGKVMREIRALAAAGLGVIVSTHDPNHALRHTDRALLIRDGAVLASGPAREVLTRDRLQSLYRAEVIAVEGAESRAFLPG
jgi:iron complex transport system ATP-binding protein